MVIEIRILIISGGHGLTEEMHKRISRVIKIFSILIEEVVIISLFISQTHQFVPLFLINLISLENYSSVMSIR